MSSTSAPRSYIYLDRAGIDSLYAQIARSDQRGSKSAKTEATSTAGNKPRLASALRALLGILADPSETPRGAADNADDSDHDRRTTEQKSAELVSLLEPLHHELYFDELREAIKSGRVAKRGVFVNIRASFDVPDFYQSRSGIETVNRKGSIYFEIPDRTRSVRRRHHIDDHNYTDSYFKAGLDVQVVMAASVDKFTRGRGDHMSPAGHDAMLFTAHQGKDIPLGVFGLLSPLAAQLSQIKPYAIWL
jgi:hypothetical protein